MSDEQDDLPPEYAKLRELITAVARSPKMGEALSRQAQVLVKQLRDTEEPTRELLEDDPDMPVDEMLGHLARAREALTPMVSFPTHQDPRRCERAWDLLVDELAAYEELLDVEDEDEDDDFDEEADD